MGWFFEDWFDFLNPKSYIEETGNMVGLMILAVFLGFFSILILIGKIPIPNLGLRYFIGFVCFLFSMVILLGWFW
jgi:hypothetical protein